MADPDYHRTSVAFKVLSKSSKFGIMSEHLPVVHWPLSILSTGFLLRVLLVTASIRPYVGTLVK